MEYFKIQPEIPAIVTAKSGSKKENPFLFPKIKAKMIRRNTFITTEIKLATPAISGVCANITGKIKNKIKHSIEKDKNFFIIKLRPPMKLYQHYIATANNQQDKNSASGDELKMLKFYVKRYRVHILTVNIKNSIFNSSPDAEFIAF